MISPVPNPHTSGTQVGIGTDIKTTKLCWILLCYLGSNGINIRAILVPQTSISEFVCNIQGWFEQSDLRHSDYELQTHRQLAWIIRSEPMPPNDKDQQATVLTKLRTVALNIMVPEIENELGIQPHNPSVKVSKGESQPAAETNPDPSE